MVGLLEVMLNMSELRDLMEKEMIPTKDISLQRILNNLLDGSKDIDLKTHIHKPKQLSALITFANFLKSIDLNEVSIIIIDFIKEFLRKMVSYKRLSRIEVIKAISSFYEREALSNSQKLTTPLN